MRINASLRLRILAEAEWKTFTVDFDSPEGTHSARIRAGSYEQAEQQLRFLRLNGRISGELLAEVSDTPKDPKDTVEMEVPLLLRLLEMVREEVKSDEELHVVVENLLTESKSSDTPLTMDHYSSIKIPTTDEDKEPK